MKTAIGYEVIEGPWGGGNRFVGALICGHTTAETSIATDLHDDILRYLMFHNPPAVVIHRINECEERKNIRTEHPS